MLRTDPLHYQIISCSNARRHRHVLLDRTTQTPNTLGGIFEAHLAAWSLADATIKKTLEGLSVLLTWIRRRNTAAEARLARGEPLTESEIRSFKRWLEERVLGEAGALSPSQVESLNKTLLAARMFEDWAMRQWLAKQRRQSRLIDIRTGQQEFSAGAPAVAYAEDFTDDEIREIEQYFRSLALAVGAARSDVRNYVIWRISIEFGLRIGEILAFRLQDLPSRVADYIKIVRIVERNDPRGKSAPRPKTLSRDLGYYFANSCFPGLFSQYVFDHRWTEVYSDRRGTRWIPARSATVQAKRISMSLPSSDRNASTGDR